MVRFLTSLLDLASLRNLLYQRANSSPGFGDVCPAGRCIFLAAHMFSILRNRLKCLLRDYFIAECCS